jgi:hypothetical protein
VREAGRQLVPAGFEAEQLQQPRGASACRAGTGACAERGHLDVLAHGQCGERATVLERAREPDPAAPVRAPRSDVAPLELHRPRGGKVEAGQHVDEGRLARAVRPDQAHDLVTVELERHASERVNPLEGA